MPLKVSDASFQADVTGLSAPNGTTVVASRYITDAGDTRPDVAGNRVLLFATNGAIVGSLRRPSLKSFS